MSPLDEKIQRQRLGAVAVIFVLLALLAYRVGFKLGAGYYGTYSHTILDCRSDDVTHAVFMIALFVSTLLPVRLLNRGVAGIQRTASNVQPQSRRTSLRRAAAVLVWVIAVVDVLALVVFALLPIPTAQ